MYSWITEMWNNFKLYIYIITVNIFFNLLKLFHMFSFLLFYLFTCIYSQCTEIIYRKEIRHMYKDNQLNLFVDAFKTMASDGSLAKLIQIHGDYWSHAHFNPRFLPWHRIYLLEFERELIKRGSPYLPYWDWSLDSQDPLHSIILSEYFFGKNDQLTGEIIDGPFSRHLYKTPVNNKNLIRDYNINQKAVFYHPSLLVKEMDKDSFSQWSRDIEYGPHAAVHSTIGGQRGDMSKWTSGNDPLFWLHHSFIDKLWYEFQESGFQNAFDTRAYRNSNINRNDLLMPWNVSINRALNIQRLCFTYNEVPEIILESNQTDNTNTDNDTNDTTDNDNDNDNDTDNGTNTHNISEPIIDDSWFNNTNVNQTIVDQVKNKTKQDTEQVNQDIQSGKTPIRKVDKNTVPKHNIGFKLDSHLGFFIILNLIFCIF